MASRLSSKAKASFLSRSVALRVPSAKPVLRQSSDQVCVPSATIVRQEPLFLSLLNLVPSQVLLEQSRPKHASLALMQSVLDQHFALNAQTGSNVPKRVLFSQQSAM